MPLRDHFHAPVDAKHSWEGFHGMWPGSIVRLLVNHLPPEYIAEPRAHRGTAYEIDVSAHENKDAGIGWPISENGSGGVALATWAPPQPTLTVPTEFANQYEYEVLVYDEKRARKLVAAVEIVSPGNKDRPEARRAFVTKCAALLQQGVCVGIVDLVTTRKHNLYAELLELIELSDPDVDADSLPLYATICRTRRVDNQARLESWAYPLALGKPLPTLPLWLTEDLAVPLELEAGYEETRRTLRIR
jgi:hypothetical protein